MDQSAVDRLIDQGIEQHQAGHLDEAERCYLQARAEEPDNPDILHLLGVLAHQKGEVRRAIELIQSAIARDATVSEYHNNLGESFSAAKDFEEAERAFLIAAQLDAQQVNPWRKLGTLYQLSNRFEAAATCYQKALTLDPSHTETQNNLGVTYRHLGRPLDAEQVFRKVVLAHPKSPTALENLTRSLLDQGRVDEAVQHAYKAATLHAVPAQGYIVLARTLNLAKRYSEAVEAARTALRNDLNAAEAHFQLGVAFDALGESHGAVLAFSRTAELEPGRFAPHMNLGLACLAVGQTEKAIQAFTAGTALDDKSGPMWHNLAVAYDRAGKAPEAVAAARKLVDLNPGQARSLTVLGTMLVRAQHYEEALATLLQAAALDPEIVDTYNNLAFLNAEIGNIEEAVATSRKAALGDPSNPRPRHVYLHYLNCHPKVTADELFEAHLEFGRPLAVLEDRTPFIEITREAERQLRVGYVSPDLRAHSVAFFFTPIVEQHDRRRFHIVCYDNSSKPDDITQNIRARVDEWRRTVALSDDQLAAKIREDKIDILVDLAGHTADNRLMTFARRPAPVQISYLGYPNTTGLAAMDYRITDAFADPVGLTDQFHTEKLLRLPHSFLCYSKVPDSPPTSPPPSLQTGKITFGSFNMLSKLNADVIALWVRVVNAVPGSQLLLKANGLGPAFVRNQVQKRFAEAGLAPDRLILKGKEPTYASHMATYNQVDIALDPFPYNGTTTSCEALWRGVPLITKAGNMHVSRVGVSILNNIGLADFVAPDEEAYIDVACRLAGNPERLADLRSGMQDRLLQSPLMQAEAFVRALEAGYRQVWKKWCEAVDIQK